MAHLNITEDNISVAGAHVHGADASAADHHHAPLMNYKLVDIHIAGVVAPLIISVWIICGIYAKIVFHLDSVRRFTRLFPDSSLLLILGLLIGAVVYYAGFDESYSSLSPGIFFPYLLPPIVFEAGYFMPNRLLFHNVGAVASFAVLGTIFNILSIGVTLWGMQWVIDDKYLFVKDTYLPLIQLLLFTSLICAVDPVAVLAVFDEVQVNDNLNISVFGESLFNDAVTVVLYNMFSAFIEIRANKGYLSTLDCILGPLSFFIVAIGGTAIGVIFAFVCSFMTKFTDHIRLLEPLLVLSFAYGSYLVAEMLRLSSILAIVAFGQCVRQYVSLNMSRESKNTLNSMIKILAHTSENIIFIFIGTSAWSDHHHWSVSFILGSLIFCLIFRVIGVFVQCFFLNKTRIPEHRYTAKEQFIMAYGGLRGAIAYGLAASISVFDGPDIEKKNLFVTTTIVIVIFTVFFQGSTIKPLVEKLRVKRKEEEVEATILEVEFDEVLDYLKSGVTAIIGHKGHSYLLHRFDVLNSKYLYPILVKSHVNKDKQQDARKKSIKDLYNMVSDMMHGNSIKNINPRQMIRKNSSPNLPRSKRSVVDMVKQVHDDRKHKKRQKWHRNQSMYAHNAWGEDDYDAHKIGVKRERLQMLHANFMIRKLSHSNIMDIENASFANLAQTQSVSRKNSSATMHENHNSGAGANNTNALKVPKMKREGSKVTFKLDLEELEEEEDDDILNEIVVKKDIGSDRNKILEKIVEELAQKTNEVESKNETKMVDENKSIIAEDLKDELEKIIRGTDGILMKGNEGIDKTVLENGELESKIETENDVKIEDDKDEDIKNLAIRK